MIHLIPIKKGWLLWLVLALSACHQSTHRLTDLGKEVQLLARPEEYPQCIFIEDFSSLTLAGRENSYQQALIKIKNKVAAYQGTHLTILASDTDELVTRIEGDGYRCPLDEAGQIKNMIIDPSFQTEQ